MVVSFEDLDIFKWCRSLRQPHLCTSMACRMKHSMLFLHAGPQRGRRDGSIHLNLPFSRSAAKAQVPRPSFNLKRLVGPLPRPLVGLPTSPLFCRVVRIVGVHRLFGVLRRRTSQPGRAPSPAGPCGRLCAAAAPGEAHRCRGGTPQVGPGSSQNGPRACVARCARADQPGAKG